MKFKIWTEMGTQNFEADHIHEKDGAIVATKDDKTVAVVSVQNVFCVTEVQD